MAVVQTAAAAAAAVVLAAGGSGSGGGAGGQAPVGDFGLRTVGQFAAAGGPLSSAITYDKKLVPPSDSRITVVQRVNGEGMSVGVSVTGLAPKHTFGVHVHKRPCGNDADASGPHYQHKPDPERPSTDPRYTNRHNEVWLDFKTNGKGSGGAVSRHKWTFRKNEARSVVLHEHATSEGPAGKTGKAGDAGKRVACFTVPFGALLKG